MEAVLQPSAPLRPRAGDRVRIAVVGGGFAAAEALIALRHLAGERVALDMVSMGPELSLRPLAVAAPFGMDEPRGVPLTDLCADHHATLHLGAVTFVDVPGRHLETDRGETVEYDAAILAPGGRTRTTIDGALLFDGHRGIVELRRAVAEARDGMPAPLVFAVPGGVSWALPAYELALMAATRVRGRTPIVVVTPEHEPLELFGSAASARVRALLDENGIGLHTDSEAHRIVPAGLLTSRGVVPSHRVVALPRIEGARIPGVPTAPGGFIPVDEFGLVDGTSTLYAAGDATAHPVKQGGLAAQQADAVATSIAARVGAPVEPQPFRPVMRGMLLTGAIPLFMRGPGPAPADASESPLWRPPGKVAAEHLSPWLHDRGHARLGTAEPFVDRPGRVTDPADREAALDLALTLADEEAEAGEHGRALAWLDAAEALEGVLPPAYADKRRRWTLGGEEKVVRTIGESW